MKARGLIGMVVVMLVVSTGSALAGAPVAVSPGSGSGMAIITQECPTFSWSQVEGAVSYRVKVFEMVTGEIRPYGEMEPMGEAIIEAEIEAPALSWTPSMEQGLVPGKRYVWYVGAITGTKDREHVEGWSEGKSFGVNPGLSLGTKEVVEGAVREYLSTEWVKSESYKELTSVLTTEVTKGGETITGQSALPKPEDSSSGSNTLYGSGAGALVGADGGSATFVGYQAGNHSTAAGSSNTFVGYRAGYLNTTGIGNTFLGNRAGESNTKADANTFVGWMAGLNNTTGYENTFLGFQAGSSNTSGYFNTFLGYMAGNDNPTGRCNTFVGYYAGLHNNSGYHNTFLGYMAGKENSTGYFNTFLGVGAGYNNTTGFQNTFIGRAAGDSNTTGYYNTFLGDTSGASNTTGSFNTFLGFQAGYLNTTGYSNTFLGYQAGDSNTTGSFNTFLGYQAGNSNTTGLSNVFVGYNAGHNETGSSKLYIHNTGKSDPLIYGEFDNRILKINGALTATSVAAVSDVSFKKEIRPLTSSLEKVSSLQGVSYEWKTEDYPEKGFTKERQLGLIAQEVEPLLPELVHTDTEGKKSLSYDKLTAVLVEAIKEQQKEIKEQQGQIERQLALAQSQQAQIEDLKAMIQELRTGVR